MDKEYICLSSERTLFESDLNKCSKCGEFSCPHCGSEVSTIKEYEEVMRVNARES